MELAGDEKRIRALFSELSLEDQITAPRFEKLWQRAAATRPAQVRKLNMIVAVVATVIIVAAVSLVWSRFRSVQSPVQQNAVNVTPQTIPTTAVPREQAHANIATVRNSTRSHPYRVKKLARRAPSERSVTAEAALLSSWQSPTGIFLESPTATAFNSLPQLNQSAEELRSFLPKTNEAMKELNR